MAYKEDRLPDRADSTPVEEQPKKKEKKKEGNLFTRTAKRLSRWFREMKSELKKVVWTSKKQLITNCVIVLVVVLASAIVIWGFDQIAMMTINAIISLGG